MHNTMIALLSYRRVVISSLHEGFTEAKGIRLGNINLNQGPLTLQDLLAMC
jgi:hypothetical protein